MASGPSKKSRPMAPVVSRRQGLPWLTIVAAVAVLALIGGIFAFVYAKQSAKNAAADAVAPFVPSATNMDPSAKIPGVYIGASVVADGAITYPKYKAALHVDASQRVAYDRFPPVGGPHDATWAACNGVVYPKAVRDENMVHTIEHGAVWITYNPAKIANADLDVLKGLVTGQTFISLSPYPSLDQPISLQSWGHQLKLQSATDPRVKEFITALKLNQYTYPEIGATCDPATFDTANPPPFDASPRTSKAVPLDGAGLTTASSEAGGSAAPSGSGSAGSTGAGSTGQSGGPGQSGSTGATGSSAGPATTGSGSAGSAVTTGSTSSK